MMKIGFSLRFIPTISIHDHLFHTLYLFSALVTYDILLQYLKMDLKIRHNNIQQTLPTAQNTPVSLFHKNLSNLFSIPKDQLVLSYLNNQLQKITIDEDEQKTLQQININEQVIITVKDIGKQIKWKNVFYIEYFGPIVIIPIAYFMGKREKYQLIHHMAAIMGVGHFIKRQLQTKFVHVFSRKTMPFKRVFINSAYYWILFAFLNSIELFMFPKKMKWDSNQLMILFIIWIFMEFCNLKTHLQLGSFRKNDPKNKGIPKTWGFKFVSCANYLWESLGWLVFSIMTRCYSSYLFTAVSIGQMVSWALKKHKAYKKQFGNDYPKSRKAIIPFIL